MGCEYPPPLPSPYLASPYKSCNLAGGPILLTFKTHPKLSRPSLLTRRDKIVQLHSIQFVSVYIVNLPSIE